MHTVSSVFLGKKENILELIVQNCLMGGGGLGEAPSYTITQAFDVIILFS